MGWQDAPIVEQSMTPSAIAPPAAPTAKWQQAPITTDAAKSAGADVPSMTIQSGHRAAPADYAGWDKPSAPQPEPSVPLLNDPNKTYGTILPFAKDNATGKLEWAVPGALRPAIRGAVEGGQEALGQRPVGDSRVRGDIAAAATFGLGASPAGTIKSVATPPEPLNHLREFVSRIAGEDISKNDGAQRLLSRLEKDQKSGGPTAQDMIDLLNTAPEKPLTVADVGGHNVQGLVGKVARAPGESRQSMTDFLNQRDMGAGNRLANDVDKGIAAGSSYDAAVTLNDSRATAAKPIYDRAYAIPPINPDEMTPSGAIGALLPRPSMRVGMANAMKIAAEEGRDPNVLGIDLNEQGEPSFTRVPSWQTLDYVKRGVDNVVEQYRDKTTGKLVLDTYGRAAEATRYDFRSTLRDLNSIYGQALDAYSGPSTSLDALRAGQDFLHQRPEEIARRLSTLGPGDREFYKLGAADNLRTSLAKKGIGADETKAIIKSQYMRDQLRPLFDDNASYDRFIKSVEAEGRMFNTRHNALGNSPSAARLADDTTPESDAAGHVAKGAMYTAIGHPWSAIRHALDAATSMMKRGEPEKNAQAARLLGTNLNDPAAAARMRELKQILDSFGPAGDVGAQYAAQGASTGVPIGANLFGAYNTSADQK